MHAWPGHWARRLILGLSVRQNVGLQMHVLAPAQAAADCLLPPPPLRCLQAGPLLGAMSSLLAELPLLPPLLPGHLAQLLAEAAKELPAAGSAEDGSAAEAGAAAGADAELAQQHAASSSLALPEGQASAAAAAVAAWQQWVAVLQCLRLLKQEQLLGLTELQHGSSRQESGTEGAVGSARSVQLRCSLVLLGALSHRELAPCRAALVDLPTGGAAGSSSGLLQQLLPLMGAASCAAPQAAQVQVLGEVLASGLVAAHPWAALQLAAAMVASLQCQISDGAALDGHVSMTPAFEGAAVGALAHTLPALLRDEAWAPAAGTLVGALVRLVKRFQVDGSGLGASAGGALAGLVAVRDLVPAQVCAELMPWLPAQI